ncbi:ATP-dependent RNA helicase DHX36-like protein [Perkinsela sp. CCAP 1560/4]|nr:ATP-dependent RNA helicase DHX36-like protein [Perkinsela sp. CCAP 1560/4]|eukprot:KNH08661.1 ATP-dependent RNA helicase DHX36-like protein [Perkinsela sp. CCAP 1560/4]
MEWVKDDCTSFVERTCQVKVLDALMPADLHRNRNYHMCFVKFDNAADVTQVVNMSLHKWVPEEGNFEQETFQFSTSKYRKIYVEPYKSRKPKPSLYDEALMSVMDMDIDRFLLNPDVLSDIEKAHNPVYRFTSSKKRIL